LRAANEKMKLSLKLFTHLEQNTSKQPIESLFFLAAAFSLLASGCGAPGEPVPPSPPIPTAITDLAGQQTGDGVTLTFTTPGKSVTGEKLTNVPTMEIVRGLLTGGIADPKSFQVVETVPGAMIGSYTEKGKVRFFVPIKAEDVRMHAGEGVVYRVRARASNTKTSADSNGITLKLFPVAATIETLRAHLTEQGIELNWTAPERTSGGEGIQGIAEYRVYRGELNTTSVGAAEKSMSGAVWRMPLRQIAVTKIPEYRDNGFDYGKTYAYVVRSVLTGASAELESGDSHAVVLTPQDTFPPAAPQGIVAAVLPGVSTGKYVVDLSWAINVEADLAGYRVYRSEQQGGRTTLITKELLPTPAFRDDSVEGGKQYWYTVTAVDRAGNESAASEQIAVEITPQSP
jgi:hypothetical protein